MNREVNATSVYIVMGKFLNIIIYRLYTYSKLQISRLRDAHFCRNAIRKIDRRFIFIFFSQTYNKEKKQIEALQENYRGAKFELLKKKKYSKIK